MLVSSQNDLLLTGIKLNLPDRLIIQALLTGNFYMGISDLLYSSFALRMISRGYYLKQN
jgi:hypothetical protein